jgi:hypothetical protein
VSEQLILFSVVPGALSLSKSNFRLDNRAESDTWTGTLELEVADARGGESGWELTFGIEGCEEWAISQVLSQTSAEGSASGFRAHTSTQSFVAGEVTTLMSKDAQVGQSGSTGGVWSVVFRLIVTASDTSKVSPLVSLA